MNHQGRPSSQMFNEMFLTRAEKDNIANWQYKVDCPGIASKILNPFYNYIVKFVPKSVSPNVWLNTLISLNPRLYLYTLCLFSLVLCASADQFVLSLLSLPCASFHVGK